MTNGTQLREPMKYYLFLILFFASQTLVFGELTEKEIKYLKKEVQIDGTRDYTKRAHDRKKIEIFQMTTFQDEDDVSLYRIRMAVMLEDTQNHAYIVSFIGARKGRPHSEYEGNDYWELYMPYGDFKGLKVTAYAVQYGVMNEERFILLDEDEKKAEKLMAGLKSGTLLSFPNKAVLMNYFMYDDGNGSEESSPTKIKEVK